MLRRLTSMLIVLLYVSSSIAYSSNFENMKDMQTEVLDESEAFFGEKKATEAKGKLDTKFIQQILKPGYLYSHASLLNIQAKGRSTEYWGLSEKEAKLIMAVDQAWVSYVLCNKGGDILEIRMFMPSKIINMSTTAKYAIKPLKRIPFGEWGDKIRGRNKNYNGLVDKILGKAREMAGDSLSFVEDATGHGLSGEQAMKRIQDSSGQFRGFTQPSLFSGKIYLLHYELKASTPEKVIRLIESGEGLKPWTPLNAKQQKEEDLRQNVILRGAYLVDRAILPQGKPAERGGDWYIPSSAFGDVLALRTEYRMRKIDGTLHFKRGPNVPFDGLTHANIFLIGQGWQNRIFLSTKPKKTAKAEKESTEMVLLPESADIYWDLANRLVSKIEFAGKAELLRKYDKKWPFSDSELSVTPKFNSLYEAIIRSKNFYADSEKRKIVHMILPLLQKEFPDLAEYVKKQLQ